MPATLSFFSHLQKLSLIDTQLKNISSLQGLNKLTELNLESNRITDISSLQGLNNLNYLNLSRNQITDISALQGLSNLTYLNLCFNQITGISSLQGLSKLIQLNLGDNKITYISSLQGLSNLTQLDFSFNQITGISSLQGLSNLTQLNLRYNKITQLPAALVEFNLEIDVDSNSASSDDKKILLGENLLEKPPLEIIRKGKKAIKAYFDSLREGTLPLNEVKVLLVGDGAAGKTSLVNRLLGLEFNENEPQTHGIKIQTWPVKQDDKTIKAHLWDFGGQQIMQASHQFFLSELVFTSWYWTAAKRKKPNTGLNISKASAAIPRCW
ncbi:MAG TPA: leucine-rich repeat domain-containing protein [Candidatus Kapabacteria bacterium]|nr:leucine-rich repeat domain-containing protein [Candidatus Kapabacteria bacterium]